jgi:hypothetical protein
VIDDPAERDRMAAHLRGGYPILTTAMRVSDVVDPEAGAAVPASFRTDGE